MPARKQRHRDFRDLQRAIDFFQHGDVAEVLVIHSRVGFRQRRVTAALERDDLSKIGGATQTLADL